MAADAKTIIYTDGAFEMVCTYFSCDVYIIIVSDQSILKDCKACVCSKSKVVLTFHVTYMYMYCN